MIRSAFIAVFSFATGVLVMDVAHDRRDEAKAKEVAELIRKCPYTPVLNQDGTIRCVATMPRFEADWMLKPPPLKLKRREIRKAVGGP